LIGPIAIRLRDQIKRQDGRTTLFDAPPETLWKSVKLSVADAERDFVKRQNPRIHAIRQKDYHPPT